MKNVLAIATLALLTASGAAPALAAVESWTGKISDSNCGAKHQAAAEHQKKLSDADCTKKCVASGGKYVFVHEGKVLNIENQDFADLEKHAGHTVKLTGEMTGDTIKVSKIVMPAKKAKTAPAKKTS